MRGAVLRMEEAVNDNAIQSRWKDKRESIVNSGCPQTREEVRLMPGEWDVWCTSGAL